MKELIPRAILFDWDGTLVDTIPGLRIAHNHVRTTFGYEPWTEEQFWSNLRYSARELYPRIYNERADDALAVLYRFVEDNHLGYLNILPGAHELLTYLSEKGIPCGIVSNKKHRYLLREISYLGWNSFFFSAYGAGVASKDKPSADPVLLAINDLSDPIAPSAVLFVGDTETDLAAAHAAGCPSALLTHGKDKMPLIEKFLPEIIANDCESFSSILAGRFQRV